MGQAHKNSMWIARIRNCLRQGYGVEDIAVLTNSPIECVRGEVQILRDMGELPRIYFLMRDDMRREAGK